MEQSECIRSSLLCSGGYLIETPEMESDSCDGIMRNSGSDCHVLQAIKKPVTDLSEPVFLFLIFVVEFLCPD